MGEPRAITYKEVKKSAGEGIHAATELWHKVGDIVGAGHVGLDPDGNASIDLTEASDSERARIDKLLAKEDEAKEEAKEEAAFKADTTKRGK
jgi:hypothetical protein